MHIALMNLVLTTTLDCNFECPFCIRRELNERFGLEPGYMTVETAKKIVDQYPNAYINLTGGEPMLNTPVLEYMANNRKRLQIFTNGSIPWPDGLPFSEELHFTISMNTTEFPLLYSDLISKGFPSDRIRFYIYLDPNLDKVQKIIEKVCSEENQGYQVLPEMWAKEDEGYERFILSAIPMLVEMHKKYSKDDGYIDYIRPSHVYRFKKRFGIDGQPCRSIWLQGCPPEELEELSKVYAYNEHHFAQEGSERLKKGISGFGLPVEYYTALMYEEMKQQLT